MKLMRSLVCEFLGTALLLATVIGSGILAHRLDMGNIALSVFFVAVATGASLSAGIFALGHISAHFNPIVTLASALRAEFSWSHVLPYWLVQLCGAVTGVVLANLMFDLPTICLSETARTGSGQWLGEFIATFGLLGIIFGCARANPKALPLAVPFFVTGAIMFTSSTCFANPAVTISRIFTNTLCGINSASVPAFIASQILACFAAVAVFGWLFGKTEERAPSPEPESPYEREQVRELAGAVRR